MIKKILAAYLVVASITTITVQQYRISTYKESIDAGTAKNEALHIQVSDLQRQLIAAAPPDPDVSNYDVKKYYDIKLDEDLQSYTYAMCSYYEISEYFELALALMQTESQFIVDAISSTNDYGLMQINKCNLKWLEEKLGVDNIMDPYQNIKAGLYILSGYLHKYNDMTKALMCYNMGETGAKRCWDAGITSTPYAEKVLRYYREYI